MLDKKELTFDTLDQQLNLVKYAGNENYVLVLAYHHTCEKGEPFFRLKDLKAIALEAGQQWPVSMGPVPRALRDKDLIVRADRGVYVLTEQGAEKAELTLGYLQYVAQLS